MASDYFLKLDGIKGESQDAKHKDEIELISFSWGVTNGGTIGGGGGGGTAGKATFADFEVAMPVNRSSPQIFLKCATGAHIKEGTLAVRNKSGGKNQVEYLKFKFNDLLITGYEENGNVEDERPLDVVRFNFAKIEMTYSTQAQSGATTSETVGWDLKQNQKI